MILRMFGVLLLITAAVPVVAQTVINPTSFPYTISAPGSYKLGGNLTHSGPGVKFMIAIRSSDVTLDLAGFRLQAATQCSQNVSGVSCSALSAATSGRGIHVGGPSGGTVDNVRIMNGRIEGMVYRGIDCGSGVCQISDVQISEIGGRGIDLGFGGSVTDSDFNLTAGEAIWASGQARISDVKATYVGAGIKAFSSSLSNITISYADSFGIDVWGSTLRNCSVYQSGYPSGAALGAIIADASMITNCSTTFNGGDGIVASSGSVVDNFTGWWNSANGASLSTNSGYVRLSLSNNAAGDLSGGVAMAPSLCADASC